MSSYSENMFLLGAAFVFLISYYAQYKFILHYHPRINIKDFKECDNVEVLEAQIKGLLSDTDNKYAFWSFQLSFIFVGFVFFIFFPEKSFYLMGFMVFIMAVQSSIEYLSFIFPLALRCEIKNLKPREVLKEKETVDKYISLDFSPSQEKKLCAFSEKISCHLSSRTAHLVSDEYFIGEMSDMNIFEHPWVVEKIERREDQIALVVISENRLSVSKNKYLFEFNEDGLIKEKVIQCDSNYVTSFYEKITFNRLFVLGLLEPVLATAILFISIKL